MSRSEIRDYTGLTCTNLMIKLKILTKRMQSGHTLDFLTTREGNENIEPIFSKNPYEYNVEKIEPNIYHAVIKKT